MQSVRLPILLVSLLLLSVVPLTEGNSAGKYNQSSGCSCHSTSGTTAASVSISGLSSSYTPSTTYTLTISVSGGVSGSNGGFSLDINKGSLSSGIGFAVNVDSAGTSATHSITGSNQRSWSVDWTAPASGSGQATINVAGLTANGNGQNGGDRWATAVYTLPEAGAAPNTPPTATNVLLGPTGAVTTSTLTLSYTYSDAENDPESGTTIEWFRDGVQLSLTGTTASPSLTSKHQEWYAVITPSDGDDAGTSVTSNILTIANSIPTMDAPSIVPATPETDDELTFTASGSDADQDTLSYETRWLLEGVVISELDNSQSVPSYATRSGENWSMDTRANDGEANSSWQTSQTVQIGGTVENTAPSVSSVVIAPENPLTGDDLSFSYTYADAENDVETRHEVEWYRNGQLDDVFKGSGIPASSTEKGQIWNAKVRVNDGAAWSAWTSSNQIIIGNTAPITTTLEVSSSSLTTLETTEITFEHFDIDGDMMSNSEVIWLKDGVRISSLDGSTTLPAESTEKGQVWTVLVRAGDGSLLSENTLSHDVTIINSAPSLTIEFSENPSAINALNATIATSDVDDDAVTTTTKWYRNGFLESSLENQTNVPSVLLGPGQEWSIEVVAHDGILSSSPTFHSITIANLAPIAELLQDSAPSWIGEKTTLDASGSNDLDGRVVSYQWTWSDTNGASGTGTGQAFTFMPTAAASVNLLVTDDMGATAAATTLVVPVQGPTISNLEASPLGQDIELTWAYEGPNASFNIERNGAVIATVDSMMYSDEPLVAGETTYTIRPILDGVAMQDGSTDTVSVQVEPVLEQVDSSTPLSASLIGFLLLLIGVAALSYLLMDRRD